MEKGSPEVQFTLDELQLLRRISHHLAGDADLQRSLAMVLDWLAEAGMRRLRSCTPTSPVPASARKRPTRCATGRARG